MTYHLLTADKTGGSHSNLRMKIQDFSGPNIPNNQHIFLHRFKPRPTSLTPKQDTVKLHAITLLSMMTNTNVTVLLNNLLHSGLTRALQPTSLIDFSAPL